MGGEKLSGATIITALEGSPPRGRGKVAAIAAAIAIIGITPAWAGKGLNNDAGNANWKDHPRVGGERLRNSTRYSPS